MAYSGMLPSQVQSRIYHILLAIATVVISGTQDSHRVKKRRMSFQPKQYARLDRPRTEWNLKVEKPHRGMTLGNFAMKKIKWLEETTLQSLIENKQMEVLRSRFPGTTSKDDGFESVVPDVGMELLTNDVVHIHIPVPDGLADPHAIPLQILHDDGVLLGINKHAGCAVQPKTENDMDNILSALHARYRTDDPSTDRVPHLAHRLDMDTSGVLLALWDRRLTSRIQRQFEQRQVHKEYLAIVHGVPAAERGTVDMPIASNHSAPSGTLKYYPCTETGRAAVTDWVVERQLKHFALVRFLPHHGRTHQIRIHALHMGHPLLGDHMYGGGVEFTTHDLLALETSAKHVQLPIRIFHGRPGDVVHDLVGSLPVEQLSPVLAQRQMGCQQNIAVLGDIASSSIDAHDSAMDNTPMAVTRCMLHSNILEVDHPSTGKRCRLEAPLPPDMGAVLELLSAVS
eukprot:m.369640 g.369640  ORF g.369640 m.369640 type:complete len:455 (-) comp20853_c0_seq9:1310-2674(-)